MHTVQVVEKCGDARSVEVLLKALKDGSYEEEVAAASALMHVADASAIEPLIRALSSFSKEIRRPAAEGLKRLEFPDPPPACRGP